MKLLFFNAIFMTHRGINGTVARTSPIKESHLRQKMGKISYEGLVEVSVDSFQKHFNLPDRSTGL